MKTRITETIEFTVSYLTDNTDEVVSLLDLQDVLTDGAESYLPFGYASNCTYVEIKARNVHYGKVPNA